jgi:hypothetical protein
MGHEDHPVAIPPDEDQNNRSVLAKHLEKFQRRFQPGTSGNPGGRPRSAPLTNAIREILDEIDPHTGMDGAERAARALFKRACQGDVWAFREIREMAEGRFSLALIAKVNTDEKDVAKAKQTLLAKLISAEEQLKSGIQSRGRDQHNEQEPYISTTVTDETINWNRTAKSIGPHTISSCTTADSWQVDRAGDKNDREGQ